MKATNMAKLLEYVPEVMALASHDNTIGLRIFFDALPVLKTEGLAKTIVHVHCAWYELWSRYNVESDEMEHESLQKDCLAAVQWGSSVRQHGWIGKHIFRDEVVPLLLAALCATAEFRLLALEISSGSRFDVAWDLGQ